SRTPSSPAIFWRIDVVTRLPSAHNDRAPAPDREAHMEARPAILQPPATAGATEYDVAAYGHCRAASPPSRPWAGRVDCLSAAKGVGVGGLLFAPNMRQHPPPHPSPPQER